MRKYLIRNGKNYYKANLCCHTQASGGALFPEVLKEAYKSAGYSIVAFCDSEPVCRKKLSDPDFLPITAYNETVYDGQNKCYSLVLYSCSCEQTAPAGYSFNGTVSQETLNEFIHKANEDGYLVCMCHPARSGRTYHDYDKLCGLFALEITNYSSIKEGHIEDNNHIYDRMLRGGLRLFPIASDGNRNKFPFDHPNNDSFGAFTMINADSLTYGSVIDALKSGDFYASSGPLFEEVFYEDKKMHIKCSPVRSIRLLNEGRDAPVAIAPDGELITEAVFEVEPEFVGSFVRVDIRDDSGNFADTPAFPVEEL